MQYCQYVTISFTATLPVFKDLKNARSLVAWYHSHHLLTGLACDQKVTCSEMYKYEKDTTYVERPIKHTTYVLSMTLTPFPQRNVVIC